MIAKTKLLALLAVTCLAGAAGCSDNNSKNSQGAIVGPASAPFQELIDQGVSRYLGAYTPMLSESDGDLVNHRFGGGDGPLCLDGSEYTMATRDQGSDELVIFLQGGGACWSTLCLATESAAQGIPKAGLLDPGAAGVFHHGLVLTHVASWVDAPLPDDRVLS